MINEDTAAEKDSLPDLDTLVEILNADVPKEGHVWVYRGQVRDYGKPLIPSGFRSCSILGEPLLHEDVQYARVFRPMNLFLDLALFLRQQALERGLADPASQGFGPFNISALDIDLAHELAALRLDLEGEYDPENLSRILSLDETIRHKALKWLDQITIRKDILGKCLSAPAGELLAQQYGFSSALLDATTSLDVACFFATHSAPEYLRPSGSCEERGVIFRFEAPGSDGSDFVDALRTRRYLFYEDCFGVLHQKETTKENTSDLFYRLLCLPALGFDVLKDGLSLSELEDTRVGRQRSIMINPLKLIDPEFNVTVGVEDLRHRPGCQCFYFRHQDKASHLNRSYLWPTFGDVFRNGLIKRLSFEKVPKTLIEPREIGKGESKWRVRPWIVPDDPNLIDPGYCFSSSCRPYLGSLAGRNSAREAGPGDKSLIVSLVAAANQLDEALRDSKASTLKALDLVFASGKFDEALGLILNDRHWFHVKSASAALLGMTFLGLAQSPTTRLADNLERASEMLLIASIAAEFTGSSEQALRIASLLLFHAERLLRERPEETAAHVRADWALRFEFLAMEVASNDDRDLFRKVWGVALADRFATIRAIALSETTAGN